MVYDSAVMILPGTMKLGPEGSQIKNRQIKNKEIER
jgi:hypothetical protein